MNRRVSSFPLGCSGLSCLERVGTALNPLSWASPVMRLWGQEEVGLRGCS